MPATATCAESDGTKRQPTPSAPQTNEETAAPPVPEQELKSILSELGAFGLGAVEPVILAALISRDPLLLIGPHGTGKSFLLTRICESLGFEWRHYNASLLNYDDLVGYPLPNEKGQLEFVKTPASIWGAQAVFLDEISRCRLDLQNKLFPIIHEKKVQGIPLEGLEYRWAAMNPPPTNGDEEDDGRDEGYLGSQQLDAALADRFAFVVTLPDWGDLSQKQQCDILLKSTGPVPESAGHKLKHVRDAGARIAASVHEACGEQLTRYVCEAVSLLIRGSVPCSTRRGATLFRNIAFVYAALALTRDDATLADAAYVALVHSLTHAACGKRVNPGKVLAVHREAWDAAQLDEVDPILLIRREADPLVRAALAVRYKNLSAKDFSTIIADSLATTAPGARHALASALFECGAVSRLVAAVAEQVAELHALEIVPQDVDTVVYIRPTNIGRVDPNQTYRAWEKIVALVSERPLCHETARLGNLLVGLWSNREMPANSVETIAEAWLLTRERLKEAFS